jgi:hypothetical protein|tara:strand:+ start:640 stop:978 length:339 start_codon:yes stop_codon:yes gene_type:complete
MVEYKVQNYDAATGKVTFTDLEQSKIDEIKEYYSDAKVNERKLNQIRNIRNEKLQSTDWMANSDVTMPDYMKTWRQSLRDVPANNDSSKYDDLLKRDDNGNLTHTIWTQPTE